MRANVRACVRAYEVRKCEVGHGGNARQARARRVRESVMEVPFCLALTSNVKTAFFLSNPFDLAFVSKVKQTLVFS